MKKILVKVKNNLFVFSFLFILVFLFVSFILYLFNIRFRLWFIILMLVILILSFIVGIIQIALKESELIKIIIIVLTILGVVGFILIRELFLLIFPVFLEHEYVTVLDGSKYVASVSQIMHNEDISYYNYYGPFLMGTKERVRGIIVDYNPFSNPKEVSKVHLIYYDSNGKKIYEKDVNYENGKITSEKGYDNYDAEVEIPTIDDNVLYEAKFGKTVIRVRKTEDVMPQNMAVSVYRSTDGEYIRFNYS